MNVLLSYKNQSVSGRKVTNNITIHFHEFSTDQSLLHKAAKGDAPERKLLENVWGEVPKNCTTAVMGPSGAGYVLFHVLLTVCQESL